MESRLTLSSREEQTEKSLFLFVMVVGYIITFTVASSGGTWYLAVQLLLGIFFGLIYISLVLFKAEALRYFSAGQRNTLFFLPSSRRYLASAWGIAQTSYIQKITTGEDGDFYNLVDVISPVNK